MSKTELNLMQLYVQHIIIQGLIVWLIIELNFVRPVVDLINGDILFQVESSGQQLISISKLDPGM